MSKTPNMFSPTSQIPVKNGEFFLCKAVEKYWILEVVAVGHQNMAWHEPYRGRLKPTSFEPGKIGRSLEMCTASTWVFFFPLAIFCM